MCKIKQKLNTIHYKDDIIDFDTLVNLTLKEYDININESLSFKALLGAARVKKMLADYQAPAIDPAVDDALQAFVAERKAAEPDSFV